MQWSKSSQELPGDPWKPWPAKGYCLAIPLFDDAGELRSVKARLTGPEPWDDAPKAFDPKGHQVKGLVMANVKARELLRGEAGDPCEVVICEGVPDWLTCCSWWPDRAVVGVEVGFWRQAHADRVPDGAVVAIRTHDDAAGWKYANGIRETFKGRLVRLMQRGGNTDGNG